MKRKFSTHWNSSSQPRKQRKYVANAPLHLKRKFLGVNLSKELRKKYGRRNIIVRKGDEVKVMGGKFKGKRGKITMVYTKKGKVTVENMQIKKQDGSKANVKIHPSNLQIMELNLTDKKRMKTQKQEKKETKQVSDKNRSEEKK